MKKLSVIFALVCLMAATATAKIKRSVYVIRFPKDVMFQKLKDQLCISFGKSEKMYESDTLDVTVLYYISCDSLSIVELQVNTQNRINIFGTIDLNFGLTFPSDSSKNQYHSAFLVGAETNPTTSQNFIAYPMDMEWDVAVEMILMEKRNPELAEVSPYVHVIIDGTMVSNAVPWALATEFENAIKQLNR